VFLMIHTPSSVSAGTALPSTYTLATRESLSSSTYTFQNLPGVCLPGGSGLERSPSSYFIQRLREFPPNIQDIIIVASTSSEDVGLFTRSKVSLANTADQALKQSTTSKFITTVIANDARRAELPMTEDMSIPTSAIGMAVDLSSKTKVLRPLPGEEMDFSPSPLPALMILNNEGVLVSWWIVYADSIRQGTAYPGLVELAGDQSSKPAQPTSSSQPAQSAFGQSAFGASTSIGAFGSTPKAGSSMLGSTSTPNTSSGAFGTPSGISSHQSPWGAGATGATSTFGKPSFGNSTAFGASNQGAAFGAPGGLGGRPSLWGSSSTATPTAPAAVFGQSGGLGMRSGSVFGASSNNSVFGTPSSTNTPSLGTGGGFSSFASAPGFAAASVAQGSGQSIFGKATPTASFTSAMDVGSSFGGSPAKSDEASGSSGLGGPFVLTSSWKNPNAGKDESSGPSQPASRSLFEGEFGATLEQAATKSSTQIKEAEMMSDDDHSGSPVSMTEPETTTPADTPAPSKFISTRPSTLHNNTQSKAMSTAVQDSIATTTPSGKLSEPAGTAPASISASTMFGKPSEPASTPQAGISASTMFGKPSGILSTPQANTPTIKSEPVETPIGVDKSLPEAPLPPDTVSKASYVPGDSSASSTAASKSSADDSLLASDFIKLEAKPTPKEMFFDDAPLPPDFTKSKAKPIAEGKIFDDAPLPPDFTKSKAKPAAEENIFDDAPLPLDFVKSKAKSKSEKSLLDDVPLRPDFLPQKAVSKDKKPAPEEQHALPEDSDTEGDDEEDLEAEQERGLNSEGSGIDVAQDLSPVSGEELSPKVSPESSFGTQSKSPLGGLFTKVGKPELQASKSLFGEVGKASAPIFPPPSNVQTSPRSPSPVRLPVPGHLRPDTSRSVSAPGVPHRAGISRKVTLGRPMPSKPPVQTIPQAKTKAKAPADRSRNEGFSHLSVQKKQREVEEVEEEQDLSDDEDERVREELASEIQPTLTLEPFLAHQDYVGNIDKPGLSGQIEKVYRDINSMIDTLGLNARSLQAFVKGHIEMSKENGRTREDLESDADWCLIEITDLVKIENSLQSILAQGRLQDVPGKQNTCKELRKELGKLQARTTEIKSVVGAKIDPTQIEALRTAPLSMEQSALRHDLRKKFTELQKLLADAEEGVSMLRAKLATQQGGKAGKAVPTVEAVHKTILTMTGMIEKKNEDIDILEQQMRKLGVVGNDDVRSREASPFMTPPTSARKGLRGRRVHFILLEASSAEV
jgi:nucleoporin NUP159